MIDNLFNLKKVILILITAVKTLMMIDADAGAMSL